MCSKITKLQIVYICKFSHYYFNTLIWIHNYIHTVRNYSY